MPGPYRNASAFMRSWYTKAMPMTRTGDGRVTAPCL